MPGYAINEGMFQIQDGWEDKSVTALSFPSGATVPSASITVTREVLTNPSAPLATYVDEQLKKLAKACPAFQMNQRSAWELNGEPAELLDINWKTPERIHVRQWLVLLVWNEKALVFTYTSSTDKFDEFRPYFEQIMSSFCVRR
jgi:hypothetical protein